MSPQDFSISLSPSAITTDAGGSSPVFSVSVTGQNGFNDSVVIAISGVPTGAVVSPVSPFAVTAGHSQSVSLSVPASAATGNFTVVLQGTSGSLTHSTNLALVVNPPKDFTLSLSPSQTLAFSGAVSPTFSISIAGLNGFADTVSVNLSGLPAGTTSSPALPFTLGAGQTQAVVLAIPTSAPVGNYSVQVEATSGSLIHQQELALTVGKISTYDTGTMLYLETATPTETTRVGLLKAWGASISEVSLNGTNYVNRDDPGREIQVSLWDSNSAWIYNPVEAGDTCFDGSPVLATTLGADSLYTKTQPIQWMPWYYPGGSCGSPAAGDAYIEKTISVVPGYNRVFKVHYKITHFGTDAHGEATQELPVVGVNGFIDKFWYYGGDAPWTNDTLLKIDMPTTCCINLHTPENWGAYADSTGSGLAVYSPAQFPNSKGFTIGSASQFTPTCPYSWDPGSVLDFDFYILVGPVDESRAVIYELHKQQSGPSPLPPLGYLGPPQSGDTLQATALLRGWVWALSGIAMIDVFVDGNQIGSATYHIAQDVTSVYPGAPPDVGFEYSLDTTSLSNGPHDIVVKATDTNGKVATFETKHITVSN